MTHRSSLVEEFSSHRNHARDILSNLRLSKYRTAIGPSEEPQGTREIPRPFAQRRRPDRSNIDAGRRRTPAPEIKAGESRDPVSGQLPAPVSKPLFRGEPGEAPFGRVIAAKQRCPLPSLGEVLVFGDVAVPLLHEGMQVKSGDTSEPALLVIAPHSPVGGCALRPDPGS